MSAVKSWLHAHADKQQLHLDYNVRSTGIVIIPSEFIAPSFNLEYYRVHFD